ncbi:MAG TPA: ATP-binding protein [Bacteriovoracaceae bacterium]|nr:ATP-binding protein [Bacteriovoracaceae bacterium]
MGTGLKMARKIAYPWFFFYRIAQLSLLVFLPTIFLLLVIDRDVFVQVVPFSILGYLIFIYFFYRSIRPLGSVLAWVQKFKDEIPFDKTLSLLYKKDEWAHVEEALTKADKRLQDQIAQAKTENEKIGAILESIYDDIIAIDSFETVLFYNSNFGKNFIQEKSKGEILPKLWHTFSDENVLRAFRSVLKTGQTTSLKGISFLADRYFDLTVTSLKSGEGRIIGALGVFYDVTELRRTDKMRVDFVANVSHEIRTPLTSIKGFTQLLQSQQHKIDPELHLFLGKIVTNTERMITLFNDLLNLSVIESEDMIKAGTFPLASIMPSIEESISTNYPQKSIKFEHAFGCENIKGDQRLIEQVITNLVDNACKYSGKDDVRIVIKSIKQEEKVLICVSDNGPGIAREHLQRIFERFYRVDSSREISRGTGLGLSIVKHIVAKHGGRIWAESDGKGSTFTIQLPLD